jgi:hypothetical protein
MFSYKRTEFIVQIEYFGRRKLEICGYFHGYICAVDSMLLWTARAVDSMLLASYGLSGPSLEDLETKLGNNIRRGQSVGRVGGHAAAQLFEAVGYHPKFKEFDSRCCHWNYS